MAGKTISGNPYNGIFEIEPNVDLTIKDSSGGGNITNTAEMMSMGIQNEGKLTLESGTISSNEVAIENSMGTVIINGGTISGGMEGISSFKGTVTISGGTISGDFFNIGGTVTISGGTFSEDVFQVEGVTIAEGYEVTDNGDGTYTVKEYVSEDTVIKKTIDDVEVTFTFNSQGKLTDASGKNVTFNNGKFTIGNKTYSASLSNNKVTEKLEQTIYTATVDDVEVTFTYNNISGKFTNAKGNGVTYKNNKITVGDKTYICALDGDEISITDPHLFENDEDEVKILATSEDDTIKNSGNDVSINAKGGNNSITNSGENVKIVGGTGKDTIENTAQNVTISGSIGNDSIKNDGASVSISGGSGNDTIENSAKNVTISAGEGNDSIYNYKSNVSIHGGGGNDTITNESNIVEVTINGGYGNDSITNNGDIASINGGGGKDIITSAGYLVTILGGSGEDLITNTGDRVYIDGGIGNDKIVNDGGAGDDILTGGLGKDLFIYESGNDTITDYAAGDKISLSSGSISETSFDGKDVIFKIGNGSLTVKDGKGKQIAITDSSGNTTRQIYKETETNAKMFDLIQDNNFVTDEFAIDDISKPKFEVTQIKPKETEELKQPEITFTDEK